MIKSTCQSCFKWFFYAVAIGIILFALLINVARALTPKLNEMKPYFESWASKVLHQPVKIAHVRASWSGLEPVLEFENVVMQDQEGQRPLITIKNLSVGLDWMHGLAQQKLLPDSVKLQGTHLQLYQQPDNSFQVKGLVGMFGKNFAYSDMGHLQDMLFWMMTQSNIDVDDVSGELHFLSGQVLPIKDVEIQVHNTFVKHQMLGRVVFDKTDSKHSLPTQMRFVVNSHDVSDVDHFTADTFIEASNVSLNQWQMVEDISSPLAKFNIPSGQANFQMWQTWSQGALEKVQVRMAGHDLRVSFPGRKQALPIDQLSGDLLWESSLAGWTLAGNNLRVTTAGKMWKEHQFAIRSKRNDKAHSILAGHFDFVDLADIERFSKELPSFFKEFQSKFRKLKPEGSLANTDLWIERSAGKVRRYRFSSKVKDLNLCHYKKVPAIKHASGHIAITPTQGSLTVDSQDLFLSDVPRLANSMTFDHLQAKAKWSHTAKGWVINADNIYIKNNDIETQGQLSVKIPKNAAPQVILSNKFTVLHAENLKNYLPQRAVSNKLQKWLSQAFLHGSASGGVIELNTAQKKIHVRMNVKDVTLRYEPDWPTVNKINGVFDWHNKRLTIDADQAETEGNKLHDTHAAIDNLSNAKLIVTSKSTMSAAGGLRFLDKSPLLMAKRMQDWQGGGSLKLSLQLSIAFVKPKAIVHTNGKVEFSHTALNMPEWKTELSDINGSMQFHDSDLRAEKITATLFNHPASIHIETERKNKSQPVTMISAAGKIDGRSLVERMVPGDSPVQGKIIGTTNFRTLFQLTEQDEKLTVTSDLSGLALNLPAPLKKSSSLSTRFMLTMVAHAKKQIDLEVAYGKQLAAKLTFERNKEKMSLAHGDIRLGESSSSVKKHEYTGLSINGVLNEFDINMWKPYLKIPDHAQSKVPVHVNLLLKHVQAYGYHFTDTNVLIAPEDTGEMLTMSNSKVAAKVYWSGVRNEALRARFTKLVLPAFKKTKKGNNVDLTDLPSLELLCDRLIYDSHDLGMVQLSLTNSPSYTEIKKLNIQSPQFDLALKGQWKHSAKKETTAIQGTLRSYSLGELLKQWHISKTLSDGQGGGTFRLNWLGSPFALNVKNLSGKVSVRVREGRVMNLSTNTETMVGLGHLINLLSVQSLPKNILTGFTGLSKKGLDFGSCEGDFLLHNGVATTRNASIVSSIGWIKLNGTLGLVSKDYNMWIKVTPNVTSSVPLIVTLAGGPLAGAIAWAANKLLEVPIGTMASSSYYITGPWAKPTVSKVARPAA